MGDRGHAADSHATVHDYITGSCFKYSSKVNWEDWIPALEVLNVRAKAGNEFPGHLEMCR
jgi:hypothetical protein